MDPISLALSGSLLCSPPHEEQEEELEEGAATSQVRLIRTTSSLRVFCLTQIEPSFEQHSICAASRGNHVSACITHDNALKFEFFKAPAQLK